MYTDKIVKFEEKIYILLEILLKCHFFTEKLCEKNSF